MSIFRRLPELSPGVYDEIVTDALESRLTSLSGQHHVERGDG